MRRIIGVHGVLAAAVFAIGCSSTTGPSLTEEDPPDIETNRPGTVQPLLRLVVDPVAATIRAGETLQLTATAASADQSVVREVAAAWRTSDAGIATVGPSGLVRGIRPGQATIQVRWGTSAAAVEITVLKGDPGETACLSVEPKIGPC